MIPPVCQFPTGLLAAEIAFWPTGVLFGLAAVIGVVVIIRLMARYRADLLQSWAEAEISRRQAIADAAAEAAKAQARESASQSRRPAA